MVDKVHYIIIISFFIFKTMYDVNFTCNGNYRNYRIPYINKIIISTHIIVLKIKLMACVNCQSSSSVRILLDNKIMSIKLHCKIDSWKCQIHQNCHTYLGPQNLNAKDRPAGNCRSANRTSPSLVIGNIFSFYRYLKRPNEYLDYIIN